MQTYPHVTIKFSIIIARFLPKYSHVIPPPNEPIKEPITNKLAENKKLLLKCDNRLNVSYIDENMKQYNDHP